MAKKRSRGPKLDYLLVLIVATLLVIGLMMVYSSSFDLAYRVYGQPTYFFIRQLIWAALGVVGMAFMAWIEYRAWRRFSVPLMAGALLLLTIVLLFGSERFGAYRSLWKGSIQPSELSKLAIIIYIADWLSSKGEKIRQVTYGLIPFAILIGLVAGLIVMQPDFGTAILIVVTAIAMFFIAGADLLQLGVGLVFGGATFAFLISHSQHASERIRDFLAAFGSSYQDYHVQQSLSALMSGGPFGNGLGEGYHKLGFLPFAHTDSIFAVLGEELGLIGCLMLLGLFVALAYRGFKIALEAPDAFGTVLASGITFWLIFQALINIAVATATLPFTGIPLPFVSYGGSSLIVSMAGVGLLLSISRSAQEREAEESADRDFGWWYRRPRVSGFGRR